MNLTIRDHNFLQRSVNGKSTNFTYDHDLLSADVKSYLLDDLGSSVRFGDRVAFDEFGNALHETPSSQPFGFTGYQIEPTDYDLFAQARQYDPAIGRFISEDWIKGFTEAPFTLNQYTYCWNDPTNLVDLDGLYPIICPDGGQWIPLPSKGPKSSSLRIPRAAAHDPRENWHLRNEYPSIYIRSAINDFFAVDDAVCLPLEDTSDLSGISAGGFIDLIADVLKWSSQRTSAL